jgi:DNA polymerase-3 subunit epsilon
MSRTLQLIRPLISFDLETTGLNVLEDRIIEISCVKILPHGGRQTQTLRLNPTKPISPEASAVHGVFDADVAHCPTFAQVAGDIAAFMAGSDLTGFNIERFDLPLLTQEFGRAGHTFPAPGTQIIDTWRIFCHFEPRDLSAAFKYYCNGTLKDAHSAEADASAAADVLMAQLRQYPDLPNDAPGLHAFCHPVRPDWLDGEGKIIWQGGEAALGFGKHRGRSLKDMAEREPDYLRWIAQGKFSEQVQILCRDALAGKFPQPEGTPDSQPAKPQAKDQPKARPFTQTSLF